MPPAIIAPILQHAVRFFPPNARLYVLPNLRSPRIVMAGGTIRQRWAESGCMSVFRFSARPWRLAVRLAHLVRPCHLPLVDAAAAMEAQGRLAESLEPLLAGCRLVVCIGTADGRQKLTVQAFDAAGGLYRVVKAGFHPRARTLVEQEGRNLAALPEGLGPKQVWSGDVLGGRIVVMDAVPGRDYPACLPRSPQAGTSRTWLEIDCFLNRLATRRATAAEEHPGLAELPKRHASATGWIRELAGRKWPVVIEHGDLAPWNLLRTADGIKAVDWEDARMEGFPGFDLVHYVIQTGVLMHRWSEERVGRYAVHRLLDRGLHPSEALTLVRLAALRHYSVVLPGEQPRLQAVRQFLFDRFVYPV